MLRSDRSRRDGKPASVSGELLIGADPRRRGIETTDREPPGGNIRLIGQTNIHPLLKLYLPPKQPIYLTAERESTARTWAWSHGVPWNLMRFISYEDAHRKAPKSKDKPWLVVWHWFIPPESLLSKIRSAGWRPISTEGMIYPKG